MNGVVYVAYGQRAGRAVEGAVRGLRAYETGLPVAVIGDGPIEGVAVIEFEEPGPGARWAKLNLDRLSPYERTLYLDADTEVRGRIGAVFEVLGDGWDMVIAPSKRQGRDVLGHLPAADRRYTLEVVGPAPLNLQAGVFGFRKSEAISRLFAAWREEWLRFRDQDQGALLRALYRAPVRVWVLGGDWNGGGLIAHHFNFRF